MAEREARAYHRPVAQGGATGAGRSTAIVLFTDLVGSTARRSRLGEDAAEELRHRHDALVTSAAGARNEPAFLFRCIPVNERRLGWGGPSGNDGS
jgi:class 3 adenylate cyclase